MNEIRVVVDESLPERAGVVYLTDGMGQASLLVRPEHEQAALAFAAGMRHIAGCRGYQNPGVFWHQLGSVG